MNRSTKDWRKTFKNFFLSFVNSALGFSYWNFLFLWKGGFVFRTKSLFKLIIKWSFVSSIIKHIVPCFGQGFGYFVVIVWRPILQIKIILEILCASKCEIFYLTEEVLLLLYRHFMPLNLPKTYFWGQFIWEGQTVIVYLLKEKNGTKRWKLFLNFKAHKETITFSSSLWLLLQFN